MGTTLVILKALFFGALLLLVNSHPINEEEKQNLDADANNEGNLNNDEVVELNNALIDVAYVQYFKNMMASYVKSQYGNLTDHEMDIIKEYLEEFCHNFAMDLKNIIENRVDDSIAREKIEDGLLDSKFDHVKNVIKKELPEMKEDTVEHITYVLRRNLFVTRQKIDKIINCCN